MIEAVLVIAGPTASGKSALALDLARRLDGVVINADSLQVYRELEILTARPGPAALAAAPHRLYGVLGADQRCSVGYWLELAQGEIRAALATGRTPIVVGGTGLYLQALTHGLAPVPRIPQAARQAVAARLTGAGLAELYRELAERDPAMAARLRPSDPQRIVRALEVLDATGRSLAAWQQAATVPPEFGVPLAGCILELPRAELYRRCDARFGAMLAAGALREAAALAALGLSPGLPATRALGLRPLQCHLAGTASLAEAVATAQQETRRYAKRQLTWFRKRMMSWRSIQAQDSERIIDDFLSFMMDFRLTPSNRRTKLPAP